MHVARKRFGQNFLRDKQIIQRIVDVINPKENEKLVEIGPGLGALTLPVLKKAHHLEVVEFDRDLIPLLKNHCGNEDELIVHECDALQFDFSLLKNADPLRIFGNLPYNISTPLIFHLLQFGSQIHDMHFMLQKEVVERLAAKSGEPAFGRLSVMVQYQCEVTALFDVPPGAFHPVPKVMSSIVRLCPLKTIPQPVKDYVHFSNLVKQAFGQRRKTLRNSLKHIVSDANWNQLTIDSSLRAEQLTVNDYVNLSNALVG